MKETISSQLQQKGIPFFENHSLNSYSSFRLGGPARFFARPATTGQLLALQKIILAEKLRFFFLGGGSNILVSDQGFDGIVIFLDYPEEYQVLSQTAESIKVAAPANARAPWFAKKISKLGFTGLEFLTTIPGQLGGAVIQNAGCYGYELKDVIASVEVAQGGELKIFTATDCGFKYRSSRFKDDPLSWINQTVFTLPAGAQAEIDARIEDYRQRRIRSQPRNRRSAGSIFKNPAPETSDKKAWQLIDEAGLRGKKKGNVEISAEHCNFIVNNGQGRAADVYYLIKLIEETVFEKTGVQLEREAVLVGTFA